MKLLYEVLAAEGIQAEIYEVAFVSHAEAVALRCPGSPTVLINGGDIEHGANAKYAYGLQCRVYRDEGRVSGVPPRTLMRTALLNAVLVEGIVGGAHPCCRET